MYANKGFNTWKLRSAYYDPDL